MNSKKVEFTEKEYREMFQIFLIRAKYKSFPIFEEFKKNVDKFIELTLDTYISNIGSKDEAIKKWIDYIGSEELALDYFRTIDSWHAYT